MNINALQYNISMYRVLLEISNINDIFFLSHQRNRIESIILDMIVRAAFFLSFFRCRSLFIVLLHRTSSIFSIGAVRVTTRLYLHFIDKSSLVSTRHIYGYIRRILLRWYIVVRCCAPVCSAMFDSQETCSIPSISNSLIKS
jgi:hypothetical protein